MPQDLNLSEELHIGLMSGTSMDGIDGVIAQLHPDGHAELVCHVAHNFTEDLKKQLMELQEPGENELHREALAGNALAKAYADVVQELLRGSRLKSNQITSIGAHGQTIRHQPGRHDEWGYTLQTLNGALLAELTGIDVIADFRSRDISANGQGAPLVPAFHAAQFGNGTNRAILNIGGISNLTLLRAKKSQTSEAGNVRGFDCGPGNVLMDLWFNRHHQKPFDENGAFARSGKVDRTLLGHLLNEPFLKLPTPKSTGRDLFNEKWLDQLLEALVDSPLNASDVQTTLTHFTAITAIEHLKEHFSECSELLICGGGVKNSYLMETIESLGKEQLPQMKVFSTAEFGVDPQTVEALAFAWLAWANTHQIPGNLPAVTGAKGLRILGAKYSA